MVPPKVFVSYSHDSDGHAKWVAELGFILRKDFGIDVILDQWDLKLGSDLPKFMENIAKADRILMICSSEYVEKCDDTDNTGVAYEKKLMTARLRKNVSTESLIPIVVNNSKYKLPIFMGDSVYLDFSDITKFYDNVKKLSADIHGIEFAKPVIGPNPFIQGYDLLFGRDGKTIFPWKKAEPKKLAQIGKKIFLVCIIDGQPFLIITDKNGNSLSFTDQDKFVPLKNSNIIFGQEPSSFSINDIGIFLIK